MKKVNPMTTALMLGLVMGGLHLLWALLVFFGVAQVFLDWIYSIHFLSDPFIVGSFNFMTAGTLIVVTFVVGYIIGWVSTLIWNSLVKGK